MTGDDPSWLIHATIAELAPRMAGAVLRAEALVRACLDRIAAHDKAGAGRETGLSAIRCLNPDAVAEARALDAERARTGRVRGPLHGLPVVLKDNIDMQGLPTTSGSRALAAALPLGEAEQTRRLRAAGAVIVAKTNLSEFSFEIRSRSSLGGDVRNPFNRSVTAGGSSGGTAASVAAGFAVAGLGTDTGGSIRTPAAFNGLVGLRPTQGLIDRRGIAPLAPSTDTIGPIARCVQDIACLLGVMTDTPGRDWLAPPPEQRRTLRGARIGVMRQAFGGNAQIGEAMERALRVMQAGGARLIDPVQLAPEMLPIDRPHVVDWEFGPFFDAYLRANFMPGTAPASMAEIGAQGKYLAEYREVIERRRAVTDLDAPAYREILAFHRRLERGLSELMDRHGLDAVVYPTSAAIPESLDNPAGGWAPELAACSGFPALTLPVGQAGNATPIGLEILGRASAEPILLGLADDLERRLDRRYIPDLGLT